MRGKKTGGRKRGTPNKATERQRRLLAAIDEDDKQIINRVISDARGGDAEARRVYFRYLRPAPPHSETYVGPIDYAKPETVEEARKAILELGERLAKGKIGVEVHDALVNGIKAYLGDKASEQQKKLDELEDALRSGERP